MSSSHPYRRTKPAPEQETTRYAMISLMDNSLPVVEADTPATALGKWLHQRGWTGYDCGVIVSTKDPIEHTLATLWSGRSVERVYILPLHTLEGGDSS